MNLTEKTEEILAGRDLSKKKHESLIRETLTALVAQEKIKIITAVSEALDQYQSDDLSSEWLYVNEVANKLKISKPTIHEWRKKGLLPKVHHIVKNGASKRAYAWRESDIKQWMLEGKNQDLLCGAIEMRIKTQKKTTGEVEEESDFDKNFKGAMEEYKDA